jgi:hypothetical protein
MNAKWLIAKYMPDIRRREPTNVGIVLICDSGIYTRFRGENTLGQVDGRHVRGVFGSLENYKGWIDYWKTAVAKGDTQKLLKHDPQQNYFLEVGGERVIGNVGLDHQKYIGDLYRDLVEELPKQAEESVSAERLFKRLNISVESAPSLELDIGGGAKDHLVFDYAYQNGSYTLMKQVQIAKDPWNSVHAAVYSYQQTKKFHDNFRFVSLISFTAAAGATEAAGVTDAVKVLRTAAPTVDMTDEDRAVTDLRSALDLH